MNKSFDQLYQESLKTIDTRPGSIIKGVVVSIEKDIVVIDSGLKSESFIPIDQFKDKKGKIDIKVGDIVDVALDHIEDGFGETILSREKAKRHKAWLILEKAHKKNKIVTGIINGKVKGGFTVELNEIRAFLPGSLVDVRPIRDTAHLEGKKIEFKVIKLDKKRNNVVVSRKAVIESENNIERNQLLDSLREGLKIKGIVKNLTDYGAFIDLGGVDGLLHITDMAWKRVKHPSEVVNIGDEIKVKVLKFDQEKTRVSLGLKQLGADPWINLSNRYKENCILKGKVTNLTDYGCFVEIEEGIEGLVHVSEMDWTNKNIHPTKVVAVNDIVKVTVLDIDEKRRRISLGLKQCKENPWKTFEKNNKKGKKISGKIKSITDFGIFIGLKGGIDGLVHLSDLSWTTPVEKSILKYKKGDEIKAAVLQVDAERERISLGIKQLKEDPFNLYLQNHEQGSIVNALILKKRENNIIVELLKGVKGNLKISKKNPLLTSSKKDAVSLKAGDYIKVKLFSVDKKNRMFQVIPYIEKTKKIKKTLSKNNFKKQQKNFSNAMTEAFKAAKNVD